MNEFHPDRAIETLRQAIKSIRDYGTQLNTLRLKHAIALATLRDCEQACRQKYFEQHPCRISEITSWYKYYTAAPAKEEEMQRHEIKRYEGLLETEIEILNAVKFAAKLSSLETNF